MILRPTLQDMADVAQVVWRLAGDETMTGQAAIVHAVLNCADEKAGAEASAAFQDARWAAIPQICQELCAETQAGRAEGIANFRDSAYCLAFANVCLVVGGDVEDPTRGATRFHRHDRLPPWAQHLDPLALIGSWFFYRA